MAEANKEDDPKKIILNFGENFTPSEFVDLKNFLETRQNRMKIMEPNWKSPLSNMKTRPMPNKYNTRQIKGKCPKPFVGCDAKKAEKEGRTCPDPRFAVFPYIQEEETGAICYPPLDSAEIAKELNEEKKALARQSVMQLIKVLAAFQNEEGTPAMCAVVDKMANKSLKKAYCQGLANRDLDKGTYTTNLCTFDEKKGSCSKNDSPNVDEIVGLTGAMRSLNIASQQESQGGAGGSSRREGSARASKSPEGEPGAEITAKLGNEELGYTVFKFPNQAAFTEFMKNAGVLKVKNGLADYDTLEPEGKAAVAQLLEEVKKQYPPVKSEGSKSEKPKSRAARAMDEGDL